MSNDFSYTSKFILDRAHFDESFRESVQAPLSASSFKKSFVLLLFGGILVLSREFNAYISWFVVALGVLEASSVYYRKAWWVTRQMLSRSSKSEVTLVVDEKGISSSSFYFKGEFLWQHIQKLEATQHGWLIFSGQGKTYLSNKYLSEQAIEFIQSHADEIEKEDRA